MNTNNLLTPAQVAQQLDITPRIVRRYCQQGRLGFKLGGRYIITASDLEQFKNVPRKVGKPKKLIN